MVRLLAILTLTATTFLCSQDTRSPGLIANDVLPDATDRLEIPREWKPSYPQNGTTVSAVVQVVGVVEKPFSDRKTVKEVFQCRAAVLQPDLKSKKLVPSGVWADLFCPALLEKDTIVRVTGELFVSEGQVKGGKHPANIRVSSSEATRDSQQE